jgi:hypothetical protein
MASRVESGADIGEEARQYRTLTRGLLVLTLMLGIAAIAALRGALPRELAIPALYFVLATALAAAWCGWKGHRIAAAEAAAMVLAGRAQRKGSATTATSG